VEEKENPKEVVKKEGRVDLNNVEGHTAFTYEVLLQQITQELKASGSGGASGGTFKLVEPACSRTKTKSTM